MRNQIERMIALDEDARQEAKERKNHFAYCSVCGLSIRKDEPFTEVNWEVPLSKHYRMRDNRMNPPLEVETAIRCWNCSEI